MICGDNTATIDSTIPRQNLFLVDDEKDTLEYLASQLEGRYGLTTCDDPGDALDRLEAGYRPDLLLVDYRMPRRSGIDFIRDARAMGVQSPAIMLTGFASKEVAISAMDMGYKKVFEKPCGVAELFPVVDQVLRDQREEDLRETIQKLVKPFLEASMRFTDSQESRIVDLQNRLNRHGLLKVDEIEAQKELAAYFEILRQGNEYRMLLQELEEVCQ